MIVSSAIHSDRIGLCLLPLFILLFAIPSLHAQQSWNWQPSDNTPDGEINRIRINSMVETADQSLLVAGTDGLYSVDLTEVGSGNEHGRMIVPGLTGNLYHFRSDRIYLFTGAAFYRSDDNGLTWSSHFDVNGSRSYSLVTEVDGKILIPNLIRDTFAIYDADGSTVPDRAFPERIVAFTATPSGDLLISTGNGSVLQRSTDLGETWSEISWTIDTGTPAFYSLLPFTDQIIGASTSQGFAISTDGGSTWNRSDPDGFLSVRLGEDGTIAGLKNPDSSSYASAGGYRLYRSSDTGRSWDFCGLMPGANVYLGESGTVYTNDLGRLNGFRTCSNSGYTITEGFRNVYVPVVACDDERFYALIARGVDAEGQNPSRADLYRSIDDGITWNMVHENVAELIGLDSAAGVYIQVDSTIWERQPEGSLQKFRQKRMTAIYRSGDAGNNWKQVNEGFVVTTSGTPSFRIESLPDGNALLQINYFDETEKRVRMEIYYSTDGGENFSRLELWDDSTTYRPFDIALGMYGNLMIIGGVYNEAGVFRGSSFRRYNLETGELAELTAPRMDYLYRGYTDRIYGLFNTAIYYSDDAGERWDTLTSPASGANVSFIDERFENILYLLANSMVYRSTDRGQSWSMEERTTPWDVPGSTAKDYRVPYQILGNRTMYDAVPVQAADPFIGLRRYDTFGYSSDNGATWSYPVGILEGKMVMSIATSIRGTIIVGTQESGIYRVNRTATSVEEGRLLPERINLH